MKLDWNKKDTTTAVYAFLVLAAAALFVALLWHIDWLRGVVREISGYLTPFVYGFALAYLLNPLLRFFERRRPLGRLRPRGRRNVALILTYLSFFCVIVLLLVAVIPPLGASVTTLVQNMPLYTEGAKNLSDSIQKYIHLDSVPKEVTDAVNSIFTYLYGVLSSAVLYAVGFTTKIGGWLVNALVGLIISIYMLAAKERIFAQSKRILHVLLPRRFVADVLELTYESNRKFSGFLIGKLIDSLIIGVICLIGMSLFRMPFPELISLIVGVTNIIPYFGPIVGCVPGFLLILITGSVPQALGFLAFILVLQQFDGNILGPAILGQSTGLSAMWVMFAILLFGGLYGFVGMIIGVPLLSVIFGVLRVFAVRRLEKKGMPTEAEDYAGEEHPLI